MTDILVPKLFGLAKILLFTFSAPLLSVGETLHVAYKKYKKKRIYFFSANTNYTSSCELKTRIFTHEAHS